MTAFKALDAWDDFENKPLHATCYVDAAGMMRWQHTGYEPFMLPAFLLDEIKRLEKLDSPAPPSVAARPADHNPAQRRSHGHEGTRLTSSPITSTPIISNLLQSRR